MNMTLRDIRLFHWRQLRAARMIEKTAADAGDPDTFKHAKALAFTHLGAVQCINDYVPGTAEQDERDGIPTNTTVPSDDVRAAAISGAHNIAELLSRYAHNLEHRAGESAPPAKLVYMAERAELARELAALLFRAAELERNA